MIEKLDGPKGDPILDGNGNISGFYKGVVIGAEPDLVDGDWVRITNGKEVSEQRWYRPEPPQPKPPALLSATGFQDFAVLQLGGSLVGMARFTEIMDATRDSADKAVRFAFARYEAAITFEKNNVASLTSIMANDTQNGHITTAERKAILDNWPMG